MRTRVAVRIGHRLIHAVIMTYTKNTWANANFPELIADKVFKPAPDISREAGEEHPFIVIERGYPRVAKAIEMTWGHRELDDYLQKLIVADRGGREGFPKPVMVALMQLSKQHSAQFHFAPTVAAKAPDEPAKRSQRDTRRSDQQW
jgi:hypothetical protein